MDLLTPNFTSEMADPFDTGDTGGYDQGGDGGGYGGGGDGGGYGDGGDGGGGDGGGMFDGGGWGGGDGGGFDGGGFDGGGAATDAVADRMAWVSRSGRVRRRRGATGGRPRRSSPTATGTR